MKISTTTTETQKVGNVGLVFNIQRFSTHDGPGIRTTVFLSGCMMRCPWCQNPEGLKLQPVIFLNEEYCIKCNKCVSACPRGALTIAGDKIIIDRGKCDACGLCIETCPSNAMDVYGRYYTVDEVVAIVLRDKVFYEKSGGGATLSGGDPPVQSAFATNILNTLKKEGIHTAIETSLSTPWNMLKPVVEAADLVIMDIKLMDEEKHLRYIGVPLSRVLENARKIADMGKRIWVRTPIIPRYTDYPENIEKIAQFIKKELPTAERYELLAFNKLAIAKYQRLGLKWEFEKDDLIPEDKMNMLTEIAKRIGLNNVTWSGRAKPSHIST